MISALVSVQIRASVRIIECPKPNLYVFPLDKVRIGCIAKDDNAAEMELCNIKHESCSSDVDHDEVQKQEDGSCKEFRSSRCGDSLDPSQTLTDFPSRPTFSRVPRPDTVQLTGIILTVSRLFRSKSRKVSPLSRIIDGAIVTEEGKLPYVVNTGHIKSTILGTQQSSCTESLIGERWVLTAGHCKNRRGDVVVIGERLDRSDGDVAKEKGESHVVKKVVPNPNYAEIRNLGDPSIIGVYNNYVALLELEREVDVTDNIIHLNTDCKYPIPYSHARFSGHGEACADGGSKIFHVLRTTVFRAVDIETCHKILEELGKCFTDYELRAEPYICALHDECEQGLCSGDSEGPLVVRWKRIEDDGEDDYFSMDDDDDTIQVTVGVVSKIIDECGTERSPDIFEPVSSIPVRINETTNGEAKFYPPVDKAPGEMMGCKDREIRSEDIANSHNIIFDSPENNQQYTEFPDS